MSDSVNSLALNKERAVQHFTVPTMAWRSTWGFQSESYRMTTSAVAKLIPSPPALVLNMKMNFELLGSLYALIEICKCTRIHENEIYFAKLILFPEKKKKRRDTINQAKSLMWLLLLQDTSTTPVSPHVVSGHPGDSSRSSSTCSSPPRCPASWSSDWRWAHENLERRKDGRYQPKDWLKNGPFTQ